MSDILFINESELKANSNINVNVNIDGPLLNIMQTCQLVDILPFVGQDWYNELQTQLAASTVTADNQDFLNRLKRPMAAYIEWRFIPQTWLKIREQGVVGFNGQNASNTDERGMQIMLKIAKETADALLNQLECWLHDNKTRYPLWPKSGAIQNSPGGIPFASVGARRRRYNHCDDC